MYLWGGVLYLCSTYLTTCRLLIAVISHFTVGPIIETGGPREAQARGSDSRHRPASAIDFARHEQMRQTHCITAMQKLGGAFGLQTTQKRVRQKGQKKGARDILHCPNFPILLQHGKVTLVLPRLIAGRHSLAVSRWSLVPSVSSFVRFQPHVASQPPFPATVQPSVPSCRVVF